MVPLILLLFFKNLFHCILNYFYIFIFILTLTSTIFHKYNTNSGNIGRLSWTAPPGAGAGPGLRRAPAVPLLRQDNRVGSPLDSCIQAFTH